MGPAQRQPRGRHARQAYDYLWTKHRIITRRITHAEYQGLRVTPNIYTTLQEVDMFGDAVEELLKSGIS